MLPKRKQWHKELDMLYEMVDELIEQRRKFGTNEVEENEKDLLTLMLESETNEEIPAEKRLTNSQIKVYIS
jgi:cytochrome P450